MAGAAREKKAFKLDNDLKECLYRELSKLKKDKAPEKTGGNVSEQLKRIKNLR